MFKLLTTCFVCLLLVTTASADIGRVKRVAGDAVIIRDGTSVAAHPGLALKRSDTVVTGADGRVGITFSDNSRFALGPNTEIHLDSFAFDTTTHAGWFVSRVTQGTLSVISGKIAKHSPDAMKVRTPSTILGVRGTEFLVKVQAQ